MMDKSRVSLKLQDASLISLCLTIAATSLLFSFQLVSIFDLAKKSTLVFAGSIFLFSAILYFFTNKKRLFVFDKQIDPFVFLFLAAAVLSATFSIKPEMSYYGQYSRHFGLLVYLFSFLIYFYTSQLLYEKNKTDLIINTMELTAVIVAIYSLLQYFKLDPFNIQLDRSMRTVSTMGHSIFAGGFIAMLLPFSLSRIFIKKHRFFGIIFSVISCGGILVTKSRGAYAAALAIILFMVIIYPFLYRRTEQRDYKKLLRNGILTISIIAVIISALIIFLPDNPFVSRLIKISELTRSARWLLWRDSFKLFAEYPFTGIGVSAFSNGIEKVISTELRYIEVSRYYDNAHNIYINTLCTMGLIGFIAYLILLFKSLKISIKNFLNRDSELKNKMLFFSVSASLIGYMVYALSDFDNTPITLLLFILFAVIKSNYNNGSEELINNKNLNNYLKFGFGILVLFFCSYSVYNSVYELKADSYYLDALKEYNKKDYQNTIKNLNEAVTLNFSCAEYKYYLAGIVESYCFENNQLKEDYRKKLLIQASQELDKAEKNFHSEILLKAEKCIIEYQLGNINSAEKLKQEVLSQDSLLINFRVKLARYYLSVGDIDKLTDQMKIVYNLDPYNTDAVSVSVSYYLYINDKKGAINVCDYYLRYDPNDEYIMSLKNWITDSMK